MTIKNVAIIVKMNKTGVSMHVPISFVNQNVKNHWHINDQECM